jgi:hypothetical protein
MFELKIENASGNIVDLNDGERFEVLSVSGLNPPSASIFTAKSPNRKGLKYNGSTLNERVVVIEVKLHGDIERSRNALYDWTDPEQYAKIYYRNDAKNVFCEGYVETCEVDLFTDNEIVNVEILCPSPYWNDLSEIVTDISNLLKQFTFPFAIGSAGVPFSTLLDSNITTIFNSGAETGARFVLRFSGDASNVTIFDDKDVSRQFRINRSFSDGWTVVIDTEASPKTCKGYQPDGTEVNLMRYIGANPTWPVLKKGNNRIGYSVESGLMFTELSVGFNTKFLGV